MQVLAQAARMGVSILHLIGSKSHKATVPCRGLVACANQNAPHTNNSQFFITMDRCDHLDRKNTIFGKVTGESIYNAMRLNEQEVGVRESISAACMLIGVCGSSHPH